MLDVGWVCGVAVRAVYWLVMLVCNFLGYSPLWAQIAMKKKKMEGVRIRIPNHLAVVFTDRNLIRRREIVELIESCSSCGIRQISLYDPYNDLFSRRSEFEKICRKMHVDLILDGKILFESSTVSRLRLYILSTSMGKGTLVEACKETCEYDETVTIERISAILEKRFRLNDPDFLLQVGNVPSLCGYPAWNLRITEFMQTPRLPCSRRALDYCIETFSQRDIRAGK